MLTLVVVITPHYISVIISQQALTAYECNILTYKKIIKEFVMIETILSILVIIFVFLWVLFWDFWDKR